MMPDCRVKSCQEIATALFARTELVDVLKQSQAAELFNLMSERQDHNDEAAFVYRR